MRTGKSFRFREEVFSPQMIPGKSDSSMNFLKGGLIF